MKHLGDITKISGYDAPPVNVVIGGSPCQDLSVAGKRAGLAGQRSGLFMEQIRIIKEMRKADADRGRTGKSIRPRYMVWENVPGAFSSNKGADFGAVLQETIRVVCEKVPDIPMPNGGWPTAGCLVGMEGNWSVAWRVLDAQFWGVPQRRRRISLIADFGGCTAPEILFEREGVPGNTQTGGKTEQSSSPCAGGSVENSSENPDVKSSAFCIQGNSIDRSENTGCGGKGWTEDKSYTLNTVDRPAVAAFGISSFASNSMKSGNPNSGIYAADTSRTLDLNGGNPACNQGGIAIVEEHAEEPKVLDITHANEVVRDCGNTVPTLQSRMGTGGNQVPLVMGGGTR